MKCFWIEGLITQKSGGGRGKTPSLKPFAQSYWANSPQEALQMALQSVPGARWIEGPTVGETSEEQRMRQLGAPELFNLPAQTVRRKSKKS